MKENEEFTKQIGEGRHHSQRKQYEQRPRSVKQLDVFRGTRVGLAELECGVFGVGVDIQWCSWKRKQGSDEGGPSCQGIYPEGNWEPLDGLALRTLSGPIGPNFLFLSVYFRQFLLMVRIGIS